MSETEKIEERGDRGAGPGPGRWGCLLLAVVLAAGLILGGLALFQRMRDLGRKPLPRINPRLQPFRAVDLLLLPAADRFDCPVGSEHGALAYNAQPFGENRHLGDDLNGIGGENTDLGDPVFAAGDGRVLYAGRAGRGWGNVVVVLHALEDANAPGGRRYVQSFYGHLLDFLPMPGDLVRRGDRIGSIGNAGGLYWAHLHLEIREFPVFFIGPGYRQSAYGWTSPAGFLRARRGAPDDDFLPPLPRVPAGESPPAGS